MCDHFIYSIIFSFMVFADCTAILARNLEKKQPIFVEIESTSLEIDTSI